MEQLWEEHTKCEFSTCNVDDTMATMTADPYVNHVPVLTGGWDARTCRNFTPAFHPENAARHRNGPDFTHCGQDQIVDELIFKFTHTLEMDWMLPGIAPTGKPVAVHWSPS